MGVVILKFLAASAGLVVAGSLLSRFADRIAERTGLGRMLVGAVLLAGATSLPELAVDISAVRMGEVDLAVGALMGSSLINLAILGLLDLLPGARGRIFVPRAASHALPATLSIVLTAVAAATVLVQSKWEILGVGPGPLLLVFVYGYGFRLVYLDDRRAPRIEAAAAAGLTVTAAVAAAEAREGAAIPGPTDRRARGGGWALARAIAGFVAAAGGILLVAPPVADSAAELAERSGLGGTFVGSTLVAFASSLPELVASLAALRMGAPDLAVGNILGSNAFNMILFAPVDLAYAGPLLGEAAPAHALTGLGVIAVTSIVVMGQILRIERRKRLLDPDGLLVIALSIGSLVLLYAAG